MSCWNLFHILCHYSTVGEPSCCYGGQNTHETTGLLYPPVARAKLTYLSVLLFFCACYAFVEQIFSVFVTFSFLEAIVISYGTLYESRENSVKPLKKPYLVVMWNYTTSKALVCTQWQQYICIAGLWIDLATSWAEVSPVHEVLL